MVASSSSSRSPFSRKTSGEMHPRRSSSSSVEEESSEEEDREETARPRMVPPPPPLLPPPSVSDMPLSLLSPPLSCQGRIIMIKQGYKGIN